jgi:membrane protein YdbS with pleckstrin-like domain
VPLPRKFLNEDEELLVELRPHWVFFARPLFTAVVAGAGAVAILVAFSSLPNWVSDMLMVLAAIPVLWFAGRLLRWRTYVLVLTNIRIVVRRGVLGRNTVQIRLQRITEIGISQKLWERVIGTGRLIVDVQGEDDSVVLEFVRKPALFQRVVNGQINELTGCGRADPIPAELRRVARPAPPAPYRSEAVGDNDTPPFGVPVVEGVGVGDVEPGARPPAPVAPTASPPAAGPGEIRDRLIELDDLRQRRIISEEEFAAKKAELLSRI